jgi:hypothetical protein
MTIKEFIRENRTEIDAAIDGAIGYVPRTASCYCPKSGTEHTHQRRGIRSNEERRQWLLNDEGLYSWARSCGVRL